MSSKYKSAFLAFSKNFKDEIPWGIISIQNYLKHMGQEGVYLYKITSAEDLEFAIGEMKQNGVNLIGISAMNIEGEFALDSYARLRGRFPEAEFVFGGVLFSTMPEKVSKDAMVVVGPGEKTVYDLLTGRIEYQTGPIIGEHLDSFDYNPLPDKAMLRKFVNKDMDNEAILLTSRGCPFQCTFCLSKELRRTKMSYYELEDVVQLIKDYYELFSFKRFFISDDIFFMNPKRVVEFCDMLDKLKLPLEFRAMSHAKIDNIEMYRRVAESGFRKVAIGAESGDDDVLKVIGKSITVEDIERSIVQIKEAGLEGQALFIIGHPQDTKKTIEKTISLGVKLKRRYNVSSWFSLAQPFPGTEFGRQALETGTIIPNTKSEYSVQGVAYIPEGLTVEYMQEARRRAMFMTNARFGHLRYRIQKWLDPEKVEIG